jgi:twitching motility two-component system response regulator PilH
MKTGASSPLRAGPTVPGQPASGIRVADDADVIRVRRRVLIAEDDTDTREMYAWCMRAAGWLVSEAANGQEAFEVAVAVGPHVIVMDVRMPEVNGLDAIVRLKVDPRTKDIPVVVCTALNRAWAEREAKQVRCEAFVPKPCRPDDLLALLERLTSDQD